MSVRKSTQYRGDVVMFLLNKIIKNKKIELSAKKTMVVHMVLKPWKPCARPPKKPMVLLYMVVHGLGGSCKWF